MRIYLEGGWRYCAAAALSICTLVYTQERDLRSEAEKVIGQWLQHGGPCLQLEVDLLFGEGFSLSGNELVFADTMATAVGAVRFRYDGKVITADEMTLEHTGGVIVARGNVRVRDVDDVGRLNKGVRCTQTPTHTPDLDCFLRHDADRPGSEHLEISTLVARERFELILKCSMYSFATVRRHPMRP